MPITSWNDARVLVPVLSAFRPAALGTQVAAQALAPKRTGALARGTRIMFRGATSAQLVNDASYFGAVTKGQKPHEIRPKTAQAILTPKGPRASASHPGARAQPFLELAARAFRPLYISEVRRRW